VDAVTSAVVTVKLALMLPAGTVKLCGGEARPGWLQENVTVNPPAGAGKVSVTVPST
jgi:hypothetical protein